MTKTKKDLQNRIDENKPFFKRVLDRWNIWFIYFLAFSIMGWVYEIIVFHFEKGYGFVNRGYLFGPYLPVYGFGSLVVLLFMRKFKDKKILFLGANFTPIICFVLITLITSLVELLTSYFTQYVIHQWLWDYTNDGLNFEGRIALKSSIRFGVIGLLGLYYGYPMLDTLLSKAKKKAPLVFNVCTYILFLLFMADVIARFFVGSNYTGP